MSWLAPVFNNRFGDLLNLELRHEQLFFIDGERITENVGYSEKGTRFSEEDFGKPIRDFNDLRRQGYWLVGRTYRQDVMREALARQIDGNYYSIFSNQCQDWADRLKRRASVIENEWKIVPPRNSSPPPKPVKPTEPASVGMGAVGILLGVGAILVPYLAGRWFSLLMGLVFLVSGFSHLIYAWKGRDFRAGAPVVAFGLLFILGGVAVLSNTGLAIVAGSLLIAGFLGLQGLLKIGVAAFSRPITNWLGTLGDGLLQTTLSTIFFLRWPASSDALLGLMVGIALISGGASTVLLSLKTRNSDG
jgi:uncharacterized membrane protein HdeD (DUF308 family)